MLRIVDNLDYQECCNGIMCENCPFMEMEDDQTWDCKLHNWLKKQPRFEDKERLIPIANITFDEDKLKEICDKAISDLIIKCPNCGTEIKPKGGEES